MMQKRLVHSRWMFSKAGQGCFYNGRVSSRRENFNFVYDCGSRQGTAILKMEIRSYKHQLKRTRGKIDLLVISHLDADHVNKVDYLLRGIGCDVVVLPYLTPAERAYLYFSSGFDDSTDEDAYGDFLLDPAGFLINNGAQKVIFITGNDENGFLDRPNPEPSAPKGEKFGQRIFFPEIQLPEDTLPIASELEDGDRSYKDQVEYRKANGSIRAGSYWEFSFWQVAQSPFDIERFQQKLKETFSLGSKGNLTARELKVIFEQKVLVDKFKSIFKGIFGDVNSTGLIVRHGPINHYASVYSDSKAMYTENDCWTLLTGDSNMKDPYPAWITGGLMATRVFQVPHHGSDKNWDIRAVMQLSLARMVANYGTRNTYGHPGTALTTQVGARVSHWELIRNTELDAFGYDIYAHFHASGSVRFLAPLGRTHQPVITTAEYRSIDDQQNLGSSTDARALSLGRAQWDEEEFSVKVWRYVNRHWSRQSEETPLHRALDLAILTVAALIYTKTGDFSSNFLDLELISPQDMDDLQWYIHNSEGILKERLDELKLLIKRYESL